PNRFNALYGAGIAAEKYGDMQKAKTYYQQLTSIANSTNSTRPELRKARLFLNKRNTTAKT
ncbi:MAG: hypothetical protein H0X70_01195, partial [Segetibacter sp.]|nr:hypothetical protein [Segetibacter sp.]